MSKKSKTPVFESVVEAYFDYTKNVEKMNMQQAIKLACDATGRTYNSSMYTRWIQKSPQQDVLKFMQHYVAKAIIKEQFPDISDKDLRIMVNNLSVPVSEEQNQTINKFFSKAA